MLFKNASVSITILSEICVKNTSTSLFAGLVYWWPVALKLSWLRGEQRHAEKLFQNINIIILM